MNSFSTELLYVLIFAAILLLQYLMKRFGPQPQQQSSQDEPEPEFPEQEQAIPETSWVSTASDMRFGRAKARSASAPLLRRRFARRSLMGTKQEVQNAIVIATILGPCRAFEPHDVR